jgi:hypothetical protein
MFVTKFFNPFLAALDVEPNGNPMINSSTNEKVVGKINITQDVKS